MTDIDNYSNEVNRSYERQIKSIDEILDSLSDTNKIFLDETIENEQIGKRFLYIIFDFLDSDVDNLQTLNGWLGGEVSEVLSKFNNGEKILQLIDLFNQLQHFQIKSALNIDADKIITKLKRDVYTLKKKLEQPQVFINTRQFEERFGLSQAQQKGLRGKIRDPLPHTVSNGKTILYKSDEIEKWMENYKN